MSNLRKAIPKDKLLVLVIFVVIIGAVVGLQLVRGGADRVIEKNISPPPLEPGEMFRGIALQLRSGYSKHPYERYLREIAKTGANTVCLVIAAYQENGASTSIFIDLRKTPSDDRLRQIIAAARKNNLSVVLMPIVLLENPREGEWRGKISPSKWDDWWEDYTNYILHYARIAEESKVELFMVGSELVSTESHTKRWRELIRRTKKTFSKLLSYSANWDHYRPVKFWDDLDIIGMTTYYDLTGGKKPTLRRLLDSWKPIKKDILSWQAKMHPNRPIMFTEVGWPNQDTGAQYPWNYYQSQKTAPVAQANCFRAFFETWIDEPSVAGFLVWEWQNYPQQDTDPKTDNSYVPKNKPAMDVIRRYFRYRTPWQKRATSRPSAPATAPVLTRNTR